MALHVYDSTGKKVGKVVSLFDQDSGLVRLKIDNRQYIFTFYSDRLGDTELESTDNIVLYYLEENASGGTYIEYDINSILPKWFLTAIGWITNKPYKFPINISYLSTSDTDNSGYSNVSGSILAYEYTETGPDFRAGFIAPFSVR